MRLCHCVWAFALAALVPAVRAFGSPLASVAASSLVGRSAMRMALAPTDAVALAPTAFAGAKRALIDTLKEEYASMFSPMRKEFYVSDVAFRDPLIQISGLAKYQDNVDLLGGRNALGKFLFKDASIELHDVAECPDDPLRLTTRWTLQLCMKVLPWQPYARFTGVSQYTLNEQAQVLSQQDYWDSLNLKDGSYATRSPLSALADFAAQLFVNAGPELLPYLLLRRADSYDVRRYAKPPPQRVVAAGGTSGDVASTVIVATLTEGTSTSAVSEAAASLRRLAESDGLVTLPGHWAAFGAAKDEVWVGLKDDARELWPTA
ncbi:hypothetical protein T492DRAFT_951569 [Pavlovales sp. CCMP2436]|nr:hypothetical protein T492DRAFT_951569 [Pavlovales sp. CCMP2436]